MRMLQRAGLQCSCITMAGKFEVGLVEQENLVDKQGSFEEVDGHLGRCGGSAWQRLMRMTIIRYGSLFNSLPLLQKSS